MINLDSIKKAWYNPVVHARFHLIHMFLWILATPIIIFTPLKSSVEFLVCISVFAIIASEFASYEANKAEIISKRQLEGEFDELAKGQKLEDFELQQRNNS